MANKESEQKTPEQQKKDSKESGEQAHEDTRVQELTQALQRLQAEFENYRKRVERDQQQQKLQSKKDIILSLLGVVDNFELALKSAPKDDFAKGIEMIYAQLMSALEVQGLSAMHVEKFDPHYHEALLTEESDKTSGTVLEVLQKGYLLGETVLRHAKVKIAK